MEFRRLIGIAIIVISITSLISVIAVSYAGRSATIIDLSADVEVNSRDGTALIIGRTIVPISRENIELYRSGIYSLVLTINIKPVSDNIVVLLGSHAIPQLPTPRPGTATSVVITPVEAKVSPDITIEECIVGLYSVTNTAKPWSISIYPMSPDRIANYIKSTADDAYEGLIDKDTCTLKVSLDDVDYDILSIVVFVKVSGESKVALTPLGMPNMPPITVEGGGTINFLLGSYASEVEGKMPNGTKIPVSIMSTYDPVLSIKAAPELDIVSAARALSLALVGLIIYLGGPGRLVDALERLTTRRGHDGSG